MQAVQTEIKMVESRYELFLLSCTSAASGEAYHRAQTSSCAGLPSLYSCRNCACCKQLRKTMYLAEKKIQDTSSLFVACVV